MSLNLKIIAAVFKNHDSCYLLCVQFWVMVFFANVKVNCGTQTQSEAAGLRDVSLTGQLALREAPTGKSSFGFA
jgi:hypothetical protein